MHTDVCVNVCVVVVEECIVIKCGNTAHVITRHTSTTLQSSYLLSDTNSIELAIKSVEVIIKDLRMDKLSATENAKKECLKGRGLRSVMLSQLEYYSGND